MIRHSLDSSRGSAALPAAPLGICTCGNAATAGRSLCMACTEHLLQQRRHSQHSYALPMRPGWQLSPPPNQISGTRRSLDTPSASPFDPPPRGTLPVLVADDGQSPLSSSNIYGRTSSVSSFSTIRSGSSIASYASEGTGADVTRRNASAHAPHRTSSSAIRATSTSSSPDARPIHAEYAPMAAGFARLKLKDSASPEPVRRGRVRPSTDLGARMFEGAA